MVNILNRISVVFAALSVKEYLFAKSARSFRPLKGKPKHALVSPLGDGRDGLLNFGNLMLTIILALSSTCLFAQKVTYDEWQNLTTSGKLPPECKLQHSNNNLDLVKYKGRYYLAFRTAPTHFASKKSVIYIVSSADLDTWKYESEIAPKRDLREPRFAVYRDTLNLYFFTAGTGLFSFDPHEVLICRSTGDGHWTQPESVHLDGFVPWRLRERKDTLYLSAYYGKNLYNNKHQSNLRLFYSTDAKQWNPISKEPQVDILSAEEGEFIFDKSGNLFATVRLEGTGALICSADATALNTWKKVRLKSKFDSALLFGHDDEIYLVSRRNIDGDIDKVKNRTNETRGRARNLIRYSITRKVTSLYKFNKNDLSVSLITDFPGTGDNAYAGITKIDDNNYVLMNYSSNIHGKKKNWIRGQLGKTYIYWTKLHFEPNK